MPAKKAVGKSVPALLRNSKFFLFRLKGAFQRAVSGIPKEPPKILMERRRRGSLDRIQERDWSKNKLGPAFLKKPEPMQMAKFYASSEASGTPEAYKMHKLLEQKIRRLIKARPFREYGLVFLRGESGAFYLRLRGLSSDRPVFIRVDKPEIARAIGFLFK